MTTYTLFQPTSVAKFTFSPTLNNITYTIQIPWSIAGQRWYFNLLDFANNTVIYAALISSPNDYDINLIAGYSDTSGSPFTSTLIFRDETQQFEVTP